MIYWFTGQPGSGKTTLARHLQDYLKNEKNITTYHIDGDDIREIFDNKDYSPDGRRKNIDLAQKIALFLHTKNTSVIVSLVSPYRDQREDFKNRLGDNIVEIFTHTTQIRGRENFHSPDYENPQTNFIDIDTTDIQEVDSLKTIITLCQNNIQFL